MVNILVKGSLKERIAAELKDDIFNNYNATIHTDSSKETSFEIIVYDFCTITNVEEEMRNILIYYQSVYVIGILDLSIIKKFSRHLVDGSINDYITKPYTIEEVKHRIIKGIIEFEKKTDSETMMENLHQREVMLQTITDHLLDVVCHVDQQGNFIYSSNSSCKVFGYNLQDLNIKKIVHPKDQFKIIYALKSLQAEAVPVKLELRFQKGKSNDDYIWVEAVGNPLCDHENGICFGFIFALRNINDRKKMDQKIKDSALRFRGVIEETPTAISITNEKGVFEYVNQAFSKVFGFESNELIGKDCRMIAPGELSLQFINTLTSLKPGTTEVHGEWKGISKDRKQLSFLSNSLHIKGEDELPKRVTFLMDITERIQSEAKLEKYTKELEEKQNELAAAYKDIKLNIEKAHLVQKQFFPASLPIIKGLSLYAFYSPAMDIGGDFYNVIEIDDDHLLFYLTDVSGHALDGAMLNIFVKNTIDYFFMIDRDYSEVNPDEILTFLANRYRNEGFSDEYFVCILLGLLNTKTMTIAYSNAGFQTPILLKRLNQATIQLELCGLPITTAIDQELYEFENAFFKFDPSSTLIMMTDGIAEQTSNENKMFGVNKLEEILDTIPIAEPMLISKSIQNCLYQFSGRRKNFDDDVTYLIMHHRPRNTKEYYFQIGSTAESISLIRENVEAFLQPLYKDYEEYLLYFHEMVANSVEHGNKFDHNKLITIRLYVNECYISTRLTDEGNGFDWRERISKPFSIENFEERGRGIMISKMYFDEITYNEEGNQISFIKLIDEKNNR